METLDSGSRLVQILISVFLCDGVTLPIIVALSLAGASQSSILSSSEGHRTPARQDQVLLVKLSNSPCQDSVVDPLRQGRADQGETR